MVAIKIVYIANIIVAGWIGLTSLVSPTKSGTTIFENAYPSTEVIKLVGCLWLSIAILSVLGLWKPSTFAPVLLIQLIYKATWLAVVAIPAIRTHQPYPGGMAIFFLVWCLVLPFVIPWQEWIGE